MLSVKQEEKDRILEYVRGVLGEVVSVHVEREERRIEPEPGDEYAKYEPVNTVVLTFDPE